MNTIIFSISSDIGYAIANNWLDKGYNVVGINIIKSKKLDLLKKRSKII